ncbi:hypothetical protein NQ176_g1841 [Zarea fungicola]|uniref:Uncharacterized protein n=1 Tax=Zarea fungicola TaxID=93591 RepID=A0ACC1NTD6_9HYPO|nr:hypothetical protein NQ176_g1841 [Lecanicillium fungicola]
MKSMKTAKSPLLLHSVMNLVSSGQIFALRGLANLGLPLAWCQEMRASAGRRYSPREVYKDFNHSLNGKRSPLYLFYGKMGTCSDEQLRTFMLARECGEEERRVICAIAFMDTGALLEQLEHYVLITSHGGQVNGRVAGVIGRLEQLMAFTRNELLDDVEL